MALPLDETISAGQAAHIDDHETIANVLNTAFGSVSPSAALSATYAAKSLFVRKSANETVNNSDTYQNDDALTLAIAASKVYDLRLFLIYSAAGAADLKLRWTGPADMNGIWVPFGPGSGASSGEAVITTSALALTGTESAGGVLGGVGLGTKAIALVSGILRTTSAGTLTLQWAQNAVAANDAIVYADSYLRLTPLA